MEPQINKGLSSSSTKPLKEKTTKAERRALQEAQRAAKAAAKGFSFFFTYICFNPKKG